MAHRDQKILLRREEAAEKARRKVRKLDLVEYAVEGDDVVFLTGPYKGKGVRGLFFLGPRERDYIMQHLWFRNDEEVLRIINSMTCQG